MPAAGATIAAITALAAVLRLINVDSGLWYDEIVTLVESARPPLREIVTGFPGTNNHPLYSVLAHLSIAAFGEQAWALRLPGVLFGIASIPLLYVFARRVTDRLEATLGAALLALSYHHIWFSQNARGYTALLFWTLLSTYLWLRLLEDRRPRLVLAYAVAATLGMYTHLTMAFVVVSHAALWTWWVWQGRATASWPSDASVAAWALGLSGVGTLLLYAPVVADVLETFRGPSPSMAAANVATPGWAVLAAIRSLRVGLGGLGLGAAALLGLAGAFSYWRGRPLVAAVFALPALTTAVGIVAIGTPFRPRFFFALAGFAVLLIIRGATTLGRRAASAIGRPEAARGLAVATAGLLLVSSAASLPAGYRYPKQDFEGTLQFMREHWTEGEPVATAGLVSYPMTRYYAMPWTAVSQESELQALREQRRPVWFIYSLPEYVDAGLMKTVIAECPLQTILPGTLGGGEIVVRRCGAYPPLARQSAALVE